jgi:CRISPR system Cascade subunit CasA
VPVVQGGTRREVSLREALRTAHTIDGLATDTALDAVAVFRQVLLPAVLHAFDVPRDTREWADRFARGRLDPNTVERYCDEHAPRFDLFHPTRPFAQIGGLRTVNGGVKPVSVLLPAVASGNTVPLFSARTDADPPALTAAQAARAVLVAHCFDTAGLKSGAADDPRVIRGTTTGNPTGPLGQLGVVIPVGATLFETLMLNVPVLPDGLPRGDRPQWAGPVLDPTWRSEGRPTGILDLLTWQSRRIRLVPDAATTPDAIRVSSAVLCAGDRLAAPPPDLEPHTAWRVSTRRSPDPVRHHRQRFGWPALATFAAAGGSSTDHHRAPPALLRVAELVERGLLAADFPLSALVVGVVYGNQQAVVDDVISDVVPLPVQTFVADTDTRATLLGVTAQAESLRRAVNRLGDELRLAAGVDALPGDRGQRPGDVLSHQLTGPVRRILAGLQRHPHDARDAEIAWRVTARRLAVEVAEPLLDAAPLSAFFGRPCPPAKSRRRYHRVSVAHERFLGALDTILGPQHDNVEALAAITPAPPGSTSE